MKDESAKRKIRALLRLAADKGNHAGERKLAKAKAEQMLKAYGWTLDDIRDNDENQGLPDDKFISVRIPRDGNTDRHLVAGSIVMGLFPGIHHFSAWTSLFSEVQTVEFRGGSETDLEAAAEAWRKVNEEIRDTWQTTQSLRQIRFLKVGWTQPTCEFSWLMGIQAGYLATELFLKIGYGGVQRLMLEDKLKRKRRRLPKKNKFALAIVDRRLQAGYHPPMVAESNAAPQSEKPQRQIDPSSYQAGRIYGEKMAKRFQKGKI